MLKEKRKIIYTGIFLLVFIVIITIFNFIQEDKYLNKINVDYRLIHYYDSLDGIVEQIFTPEGLRYNYTRCYLTLSGEKMKIITTLNEKDSIKFRYSINKGDLLKKKHNSLMILVIKPNSTEKKLFFLDTTNTQVW